MSFQLSANRYCSFIWTGATQTLIGTVFDTAGVNVFEYISGNIKAFTSGRNNALNGTDTLTQWRSYICFTTVGITLPDTIAGIGSEPLTTTPNNVFLDDFIGSTLDTTWHKLNDAPSTEPWTLGTIGGRSVLSKATSPNHGFYKSAANGETEGGVIPVLYLSTIGGSPIVLGDSFEVITTVGFSVDAPLGQVGFVVLPMSEITNNAANFANYVKCCFEYSFTNKQVVMLKETNDLDVRGGQDVVIPVSSSSTGAPLSIEMRFRYLSGNFVFDYRAEGATVWVSGGSRTPNFVAGTAIAVGLYCEEDHLTPSQKSGWWDKVQVTNGVYTAPPPTLWTVEPSFSGLTYPSIPSGLNWVRAPLTPLPWSYSGGKIQIPTVTGNIWQSNGNTDTLPFLYYNIGSVLSEGFEAVLDVNYATTAQTGQGGLLLSRIISGVFDQDNYFRVFASTGEGLLALKEISGVPDTANINVVGSYDVNTPVTLRLRYARNSSNALKLISEYRAIGTTVWQSIGEQDYTPISGNLAIGIHTLDFTGGSPNQLMQFTNFKVKVS